jgi:hypothetical protein
MWRRAEINFNPREVLKKEYSHCKEVFSLEYILTSESTASFCSSTVVYFSSKYFI